MEPKEKLIKGDASNEPANLKKISEVNNFVNVEFGNLVICSANEEHVKELGELWANLAAIQQVFAPQRYDFGTEGKDWQAFVKKKLSKEHNLLLVAQDKGCYEVKGFLYLQTIVIPSSDLILKGVTEDIYTKPQYRKQNIASKMLSVALNWTHEQNIKQVDFVSIDKTRGLSEFYTHFLSSCKPAVNLELLRV